MRRRNIIASDERSSESRSFKNSSLPHDGGADGRMAEKVASSSPIMPLQAVLADEGASLHQINPSPVESSAMAALERHDDSQDASQRKSEPWSLPRPVKAEAPFPVPSSITTVTTPQAPNERKMFFAFVKVLLKYLEKTNDDSLRKRAKAIISECTFRNRNGDSDYLCLQGAIERRLQQSLGPYHWDRAQVCYHKFLERCRMPSTIEVTSSACV